MSKTGGRDDLLKKKKREEKRKEFLRGSSRIYKWTISHRKYKILALECPLLSYVSWLTTTTRLIETNT